MRFEKVSFEQYLKSYDGWEEFDELNLKGLREEYDNIKLPKRSTNGSAGYDFFSPIRFVLISNDEKRRTVKIPTGIRVILDDDKFLGCYPRSGQGFKYRLQLDNTVGIIDSDYSKSDNEGHIFAKITIDAKEPKILEINAGTAFMQGIIQQFFKTEDDNTDNERNGGFGSTDVK